MPLFTRDGTVQSLICFECWFSASCCPAKLWHFLLFRLIRLVQWHLMPVCLCTVSWAVCHSCVGVCMRLWGCGFTLLRVPAMHKVHIDHLYERMVSMETYSPCHFNTLDLLFPWDATIPLFHCPYRVLSFDYQLVQSTNLIKGSFFWTSSCVWMCNAWHHSWVTKKKIIIPVNAMLKLGKVNFLILASWVPEEIRTTWLNYAAKLLLPFYLIADYTPRWRAVKMGISSTTKTPFLYENTASVYFAPWC